MVSKLIVVAHQRLQYILAAGDMVSNDKECCCHVVGFENFQYLPSILRWRIVDGEGYALPRGRYIPQHIRPSTVEVAYQESWLPVDDIEWPEQYAQARYKPPHR